METFKVVTTEERMYDCEYMVEAESQAQAMALVEGGDAWGLESTLIVREDEVETSHLRIVSADPVNSLTPPDLKQCQSEVPGNGPFVMGGEIGNPRNGYLVRCKSKTAFIATENKPGEDGQTGQMGLCKKCKDVMIKQCGKDYASFRKVDG